MLFYFDVQENDLRPDCSGVDLPDISAARRQAVQYAGEAIRDSHAWQSDRYHWSLEVSDERGFPLMRLTFDSLQSGFTLRSFHG